MARKADDLVALLERLPGNVTNLRLHPDGTYEVSMVPAGPVPQEPTKRREKPAERRKRDIDTLLGGVPDFGVIEQEAKS